VRSCVRRRVHFRRAERHDRFVGGQKPPREVTGPSRVRCYNRGRRRPVGGPRKTARARSASTSGVSFVRLDLRGLPSVPADCGRSAASVGRRRLGVGGESVGHLSDPSCNTDQGV
jgi:hypothetical protein